MMFSKSAERRVNVGKASWALVFVRHGCRLHTHTCEFSVLRTLRCDARAHDEVQFESTVLLFRGSPLTVTEVTILLISCYPQH